METNPNELLQTEKQSLIIADVPDTCLDNILSNLDVKDLVEVSKTNFALRHSAIRVFQLKCGKKKFEIEHGNEIDMPKMIIHFGAHISNIKACNSNVYLVVQLTTQPWEENCSKLSSMNAAKH